MILSRVGAHVKREQGPFSDEYATLAGVQGRVAIFGGTFNPIHAGHVRLTIELTALLGLSKLVCMPCAIPPHKSAAGILPFALRYALAEAAVEHAERVCVSDLEVQIDGPSYTWHVLQLWHKLYETRPLFIVGLEDFSVLDTWKSGLDLPLLADFIVVPRGNDDHTAFQQIVQNFWQVSAKPLLNIQDSANGQPTTSIQNSINGQPLANVCVSDNINTHDECTLWQAELSSGMALYVPLPYLDLSATRLRTLFVQGQDIQLLVPDACMNILEQHRAEIMPIWAATADTD